jgi:hypothetical protein
MTQLQTLRLLRKYLSAVRWMARNRRLGRYQGRNNGGDSTYAMTEAERLTKQLPRKLQGLVWAEHRLSARISENRDAGVDRPELKVRLRNLRREIKEQS